MNADNYVLSGEKTEKVLKKMEKEGYIVKVRERDGGGEESVDFVVGPRGKAEVSESGVAGIVRKVWGVRGPERAELEKRLVRSLGEGIEANVREEPDGEGEAQEEAEEEETRDAGGRRRGSRGKKATRARQDNGRRTRSALVDEEAEGDEDEEEDEDVGDGSEEEE
ncbi:MAG: hypothetical protein Q9183_005929 [Haloplaca sp. 2 TL-2023]